MSTKAKSKTTAQASEEQIKSGLKSVTGEEIAQILIEKCEYSAAPFTTQRAHRLKAFAIELLSQMGMLWSTFASYASPVQKASVKSTTFPPPKGSVSFFAVCSSVLVCVRVCCRCF